MEYRIEYTEIYTGDYYVEADTPEAALEEFNNQIAEGKIDFSDLNMVDSSAIPVPCEFPILKEYAAKWEYDKLIAALPTEKIELIESVIDSYRMDDIDIAYDPDDENPARLIVTNKNYVIRGGETVIVSWICGLISVDEVIEYLLEDDAPSAENSVPALTQEEISILSDGILALIANASDAKRLIHDDNAHIAVNAYVEKLQALNRKILGV